MAELRWTNQAADDLQAICQFIARDSASYASLIARNIIEAVERARDFPTSGRIVPEVGDPAIRELLLGNYRIIDQHAGDTVVVLTVWHGARLLRPEKFK